MRKFDSVVLLASLWLTACAGQTPPAPVASQTQPIPNSGLTARIVAPTPACNALAETPAMTEGPYYKANPPERTALLEPNANGQHLVITGYVVTVDCTPVPRARVDFWQADEQGAYDNAGYNLRGYQFTDDGGRYYVETVVPGLYPGRTRHIHVKVQAPNQPPLTTQLFFPGEAGNAADAIFSSKLVMTLHTSGATQIGNFNFVLKTQ